MELNSNLAGMVLWHPCSCGAGASVLVGLRGWACGWGSGLAYCRVALQFYDDVGGTEPPQRGVASESRFEGSKASLLAEKVGPGSISKTGIVEGEEFYYFA
jgi:hypothetical protein